MLSTWFYALTSILIISIISQIGLITLSIKINKLKKITFFLISFAAGALLGDTFIHLTPEIKFDLKASLLILSGILIFFILEKFIQWRHCHMPITKEHTHPFVFMNLVGDSLHNFIDGIIIAASYLSSLQLGIATTISVILHEIPQEIGEFGVLIYGGFTKAKALFFNFLTSLTAFFGGIIILIINTTSETTTSIIIPFTIGSFIYIAGSDLIPELHKEKELKRSTIQFIGLILGIMIMLVLILVE